MIWIILPILVLALVAYDWAEEHKRQRAFDRDIIRRVRDWDRKGTPQ